MSKKTTDAGITFKQAGERLREFGEKLRELIGVCPDLVEPETRGMFQVLSGDFGPDDG